MMALGRSENASQPTNNTCRVTDPNAPAIDTNPSGATTPGTHPPALEALAVTKATHRLLSTLLIGEDVTTKAMEAV